MGPNAKFKGSGEVNESGSYGFLLTGVDGDVDGGGEIDKFRIKIWDLSTDAVVYDNQLGTDDTGYESTALGGGSITIHSDNQRNFADLTERFVVPNLGITAIPNPSRGKVQLTIQLPEEASTQVQIVNLQGVVIRDFDLDVLPAGTYQVNWDGRSKNGAVLPGGMYLVQVKAGKKSSFLRIMLLP